MKWQDKDRLYTYEGELGPKLNDDGTAELILWSPSADQVNVLLYDKENQDIFVGKIAMDKGVRGTWVVQLTNQEFSIQNFRGYYYHYEIIRNGRAYIGLDPYAKSLGAWNSQVNKNTIAKAAIINPSIVGKDNTWVEIDGFKQREDAIIYEIHIRDFTSDPSISDSLGEAFGTFTAFIQRLDYIKSLGVTHIQLLPILSYYNVNELENRVRYLQYKSAWSNYNWGYDPQHYFSLTGVYSKNPENPEMRIAEFKELVNEIHKRGMGVTLDVVYNHTAKVHVLENLEPNYYYFMDNDGRIRQNFGGGRLGSTHFMTRRLIIDSLKYLTEEFKVDGFRFDMMGDLDAETIELAHRELVKINPNILLIGEGWLTYVGDEGYSQIKAADQDWMSETNFVASFSDDFRDELKSGYQTEGEPRFLSGGPRSIWKIFSNLKGQPTNFEADEPGDVVQYLEAHDNMTLHDVLAYALKKDPNKYTQEIHQRIRLGNFLLLTSQGIVFIHGGQEYGRTKQFKHPDYRGKTNFDHMIPDNSTYVTDKSGEPINYPYFIHDSYNSSDAVNMFEWEKVFNSSKFPQATQTLKYTKGLIRIRKHYSIFRLASRKLIDQKMNLIQSPDIKDKDLVIIYSLKDKEREFIMIVNADSVTRKIAIDHNWSSYSVLVDQDNSGIESLLEPKGMIIGNDEVIVNPLTSILLVSNL